MNRGRVQVISLGISVFILIAAGAMAAKAQILTAQEFSGRVTGINAIFTTNGAATTNIAGDTCPLPPRGGTSTVTTSGIIIPGALASGTIVSTTSGSGITSQSSSSVADFFFSGGGWSVHATNVTTSTQCNCCDIASPGCSGTAGVNGLTVTGPSGSFPVTVTGATNQVVTLPNGAGTITFNERTSSTGSLTVNGIHINITNGTTNYNVIVASSHSNILCPGVVVTAGEASISGRTLDQSGAPVARVGVSILNIQGAVVAQAMSAVDGTYTLGNVTVGQTYIIQGTSKTFTFAPRTLNLVDDTTGFDLTGTPRL